MRASKNLRALAISINSWSNLMRYYPNLYRSSMRHGERMFCSVSGLCLVKDTSPYQPPWITSVGWLTFICFVSEPYSSEVSYSHPHHVAPPCPLSTTQTRCGEETSWAVLALGSLRWDLLAPACSSGPWYVYGIVLGFLQHMPIFWQGGDPRTRNVFTLTSKVSAPLTALS